MTGFIRNNNLRTVTSNPQCDRILGWFGVPSVFLSHQLTVAVKKRVLPAYQFPELSTRNDGEQSPPIAIRAAGDITFPVASRNASPAYVIAIDPT